MNRSSKRQRLLWFKPILPYPADQGTKRVTLQLLKNLQQEFDIHLFTRLLSREETEQVHHLEEAVPGLKVEAVITPNRRSLLHRAFYRLETRSLANRANIPPVESYTSFKELVRRFGGWVDSFDPDLVVVEYWYAGSYLKMAGNRPSVLFAHDIEYQVRERAGNISRGQARGHAYGVMEKQREAKALKEAKALWFLTEGDQELARRDLQIPAEKTQVMPYGLSLENFRASSRPAEGSPRVLLFGSFAADFNQDALDFTLNEIWPRLKQLKSNVELTIAGGGMTPSNEDRIRGAGATVRGVVEDVSSLLGEATVVLIPLRYGGGLRIRLLEALASECAVVGTGVGVLGMGPEAERHVLVGETAQELAGQVVRLLEDPELRKGLGKRGREWVLANRDLATVSGKQIEVVRKTLDQGKAVSQ